MERTGIFCPQCKRELNSASSRLVVDSCGHPKCRLCLLEDEDNCKQCLEDDKQNVTKLDDNHTAVITYPIVVKQEVQQIEQQDLLKNHNDLENVVNLQQELISVTNGKVQQFEQDLSKSNNNSENTVNLKQELIFVTSGRVQSIEQEDLLKRYNDSESHVNQKQELSSVSRCKIQPIEQHDLLKNNNDSESNVNLKQELTSITNTKDEGGVGKKRHRKSEAPRKIKSQTKCPKRNYNFIVIPDHITVLDPLRYECTVCKKVFCTKTHIRYHSYCISTVPKPYKCRMCPKEFVTKSQLNLHNFKHSDLKLYSCEICGKSFCESTKLRRHQLVHTHLKTHICANCGKAFGSKDLLKVHSLTHLTEKPFKCSVCDARFNHTSNLKKHLDTHSGEKGYMCDQCGKRFKLKCSLGVHRKSHSRNRPYTCAVCSKTFIILKDLQRHQLSHLNSNLYSCSVCNTEFKRKDNLLRHIKNTHPGKKAEAIKISAPSTTNLTRHIVDNPNAIKVITASPLSNRLDVKDTVKKSGPRPGTVINGPLKLAFKTDAFKNNYNIHRDYEPPNDSNGSFDLAESVNICQKILAPHNPARNIIRKVSDVSSSEICQKILQPYSAPPTLHYETSYEHKNYGSIRNIKFKLPPEYINLTMRTNDDLDDDTPDNSNNMDSHIMVSENKTYTELKTLSPLPNAASVIVNTNSSQSVSDMHWRRRTLENLTLRNM